jgi:phage head maturation protease
MIYCGHLAPGRYVVGDDGVARKAAPPKRQALSGWACHYNVEHTNYKTGLREIFLPGCFTGSLTGVFFLRDHILSEPKMADQDDGDLELHDSETGLAMRVHLKDGVLDRLEGRDQLSVGYHVLQASLRSDGVMLCSWN